MHVSSSISPGSWQAVGAGIRAEFQSQMMRGALGSAELLDANLSAGLDALATTGRSVTRAGLLAMRHDLVGSLIDELA